MLGGGGVSSRIHSSSATNKARMLSACGAGLLEFLNLGSFVARSAGPC